MNFKDDKPKYYKHKVGDGLHYVNNNFKVFADGTYVYGTTSEGGILLHTSNLCSVFSLPRLDILWAEVYPHEPMDIDDLSTRIANCIDRTVLCDPRIPDNRADIIMDLKALGRPELAERIKCLLEEMGVVV